ncbi:elongation factor P [Candidatus Curtissbacteria bacterium]|nr:elongation factor P [Candidatus Curtissbacteria bacterium]
MISVTELRAGTVFEDRGEYFLVLAYEHIKMGRGGGIIKVKVRNLATGANIEKSFASGARVQDVNIERKKVQYLYRNGEGFHFMDTVSFEQFSLADRLVDDYAPYFKEGLELTLFAVDDRPMYVEIPKILEYRVTQTGGSARGNTAGAAQKDALLENGLHVKVPLFIKNGEVIRVDTRTGTYVERAK